jgi:hypothetical protein
VQNHPYQEKREKRGKKKQKPPGKRFELPFSRGRSKFSRFNGEAVQLLVDVGTAFDGEAVHVFRISTTDQIELQRER